MAQQETAASAAPPETVYPPSPQWNQPHSACLAYPPLEPNHGNGQQQGNQEQQPPKGWFLYTLNSAIHVLNPASFKYEGMLVGPHTSKINALAARHVEHVSNASSSTAHSDSVEALLKHTLSSGSSISPFTSHEQSTITEETVASSCLPETRTIVASAGDDRIVVCWDVVARQPIFTLPNAHETEIKAVEWLYDGMTVVSGDRSGSIATWSPFKGKHFKRSVLDKSPIACIRACSSPGQENVAAIGYETGDILVCQLRISDTVLLRRLHGHVGRIHSLAWQPYQKQRGGGNTMTHTEKQTEAAFTYLASGSADQTIRIWDVDKTRTKMVAKIPAQGGKQGQQQQGRVKAWVPVEWTADGLMFMSFTSRGGHIMWKVDGAPEKTHKILGGCQHTRMVYQVLVWRTGEFGFSFGMDRRIIVWDLNRQEGIVQVDGLAGPVDAVDVSLLDPRRLAIASGNDSIAIWNTQSQDVPFESIIIDRLTSRVRCLAWHPSEEGAIAIGLDNGKIGMIDRVYEWDPQQALLRPGKYKTKKSQPAQGPLPTFFPSYHGSSVLSIQWCSSKAFSAPISELLDLCLQESSSCLVTCGDDGRILVTVVSKSSANKTSLDLDSVLTRQNPAWYEELRLRTGWGRLQRRGVAIHPNEDLMAIGNADGSVEIVELQYFKVVHVYHGHKSRLDQLAWCKAGGETDDSSASDRQRVLPPYLLACGGGDDGFISILHLDQYAPKNYAEQHTTSAAQKESGHSIVPSLNCMQTFHCHPVRGKRRGCSSLEWSPFSSLDASHQPIYRFASASYDGSVAVCEVTLPFTPANPTSLLPDTLTPTTTAASKRMTCPVARFVAHFQIANTVRWSQTDEHGIYTGGSDWRVCLWDWRKYQMSEESFKELLQRDQSGSSLESSAAAGSGHRKKHLHPEKSVKRGAGKAHSIPANDSSSTTETLSNKRHLSIQADTVEGSGEVGKDPVEPPKKRHALQNRGSPGTLVQESIVDDNAVLATTSKRTNLFPKSSAAFKTESRRRSLLEIIRLARNLYCRPKRRQPGMVDAYREHRQRWKAMLRFFEADGESEGLVLAAVLRKDVHELNIGDDEESDEEDGVNDPAGEARLAISDDEGSIKIESSKTSVQGESDANSGSVSSVPDVLTSGDPCLEQPYAGKRDDVHPSHLSKESKEDDITDGDAYGDIIFYGSREAIVSLAQMESQALAALDAENGRSIFHAGAGMGVVHARVQVSSRRGAQSDSTITALNESDTKAWDVNGHQPPHHIKKTAPPQLSRIPISYWLGDVPDMAEILSSTANLGVHDWIGLALSPMGGVAAWKSMMGQMANKCLAHGEVHAAVLCLLGIGNVREAVEAYRSNDMFREALMLLKIRTWEDDQSDEEGETPESKSRGDKMALERSAGDQSYQLGAGPGETPKVSMPIGIELQAKILTDWGRLHERRGEYEQAAKCQLALGSLLASFSGKVWTQGENGDSTDDALKSTFGSVSGTGWSMGLQTLSRRGDISTLRVVAGLTILLDDRFRQPRIQQYKDAVDAKRLADEHRRLKK